MPPDPAQGEQGCEMDEGHEFSGRASLPARSIMRAKPAVLKGIPSSDFVQ
jgi:hypothetical protein